MRVYSQQKPTIVLEGTNLEGYVSGNLEAYADDGKISIRATLQDNSLVAEKIEHTEYKDSDGNSFGNLQETIDALNSIFSEESTEIKNPAFLLELSLKLNSDNSGANAWANKIENCLGASSTEYDKVANIKDANTLYFITS